MLYVVCCSVNVSVCFVCCVFLFNVNLTDSFDEKRSQCRLI